MYLKDINNKSWRLNESIKIEHCSDGGISTIEQENHITVLKSGFDDPEEKEIIIDCSFQEWITQYSHCEFFELREVLVSDNPRAKDFILSIKGKLDYNGLTIRKKKPVFSEEERQVRAERAKKYLKRK